MSDTMDPYSRMVTSSTLGKNVQMQKHQLLEKRTQEDLDSRRTRIICTMGPPCWSVEMICKLIDAGMNVCRLNFSHGDHEVHARTVENIKEAMKLRPHNTIAILLDTKGPEIRTGILKDGKAISVKAGEQLTITTDYTFAGDSTKIACSYSKLATSVKPGNVILIADGSLSVEVLECKETEVVTKVLNDATFGEKKNMNLPGVKVDLPVIGEKDKNDIIKFGIPMGCNFIAASFVQTAEDVRYIRNILGPRGRHIKIIPKIENLEGINNFSEIVDEADGIMVARGDMGMEIPPEKVFLAQKMMISKCNIMGKPVITATQMLESMTKNPRPTRAEAADVANAVLDGTDCVMLSGETASGSFPYEAVSVMSKICVEAEACIDYPSLYTSIVTAIPRPIPTTEAVGRSAVETAEAIDAKIILALTETGHTAKMITKYRPRQMILALTASESTAKHLQVNRGITVVQVSSFQGTDSVIRNCLEDAKKKGIVSTGDFVVAVHGIKEEVAGSSNLMKVVTVD